MMYSRGIGRRSRVMARFIEADGVIYEIVRCGEVDYDAFAQP